MVIVTFKVQTKAELISYACVLSNGTRFDPNIHRILTHVHITSLTYMVLDVFVHKVYIVLNISTIFLVAY
jgi:hypothetical protein